MCGLAGYINLAPKRQKISLIREMTNAIAHRGPDDEGYLVVDGNNRSFHYSGVESSAHSKATYPHIPDGEGMEVRLALSHRRFSIVDLSPAGHQPFFDASGKFAVVFNGEIYNYIELREELEKSGAHFHSHSDTEVLLEAYKHWGESCFARFNGFWAVAIYDFERGRLVISRDRLGKKPLYWTKAGDTVYFASEIKSLLKVKEVYATKQVDEESLFHWMVYGKKDIDNRTFFKNVYSLPAGSWATVDAQFPATIQKFWELPGSRLKASEISVEESCRQIREILGSAVDLRLRADVPVALELSGGLDSSSLAAMASRNRSGLSAYTVSFEEKEANETAYASSIADRFGLHHKIISNPPENIWGSIVEFTVLEEEPFHAPNLMSNQWVWRNMRQDGVKVSINGAAGDELFGGYPHYYKNLQNEHLNNLHLKSYVSNAWNYTQSSNRLANILKPIFFKFKNGLNLYDLPPDYFNYKQKFTLAGAPTLSGILKNDMTNLLMPYWLRSGDKSSMGIPIEVRAPLLDYRMVDLAFQLPVSYLIRDGWHKWILRKSFEGVLPNDVLWRKNKMGFPFPYQTFFQRSKPLIDRIIDTANNPYIDKSKREVFGSNWKVISFMLWYEMFINDNDEIIADIRNFAASGEGKGVDSLHRPDFYRTCNVVPR